MRIAKLILLGVVLLSPLTATAWGTDDNATRNACYDVAACHNITYFEQVDDPDQSRHQLDVYRPVGKDNCPVLFFVHGGAWVFGKKDDVLGLHGYGTIAREFARRGLVVVLPNYRLSPAVRHPEHIKDVARALAWTCRHVKDHGGDPRNIFVGGHSAGGHLTSLLATDETYLKEEGRSRDDIRGVLSVSGVYSLNDLELNMSLGDRRGTARMKLDIRPFAVAFGSDPEVIRQASPMTHVKPGLPPFLILTAGMDYPQLRRMASKFTLALEENCCKVECKVIPWRDHVNILFDLLRFSANQKTVEVMLKFIEEHKAKPAPAHKARS